MIAYTAKPVIWGMIAARLSTVPVRVALITGLGFAFTDRDHSGLSRGLARVVRWLYWFSLRFATTVIFQNPDDKAEFVRLRVITPAQKLCVVDGSGVDTEWFRPAPLPGAATFLLIARLLADKGVREYAEAARVVRMQHPSARFRLVGWFDENPSAISRAEVEAWVARGDIEYVGALEDVRPAIAAAAVYVLPSYREGTPRTVLEAMAMARPIITTDTPGCRETVRCGVNGFLVPPRNVPALAEAMLRFITDPSLAARMGAQSRAIAEQRYDARRVARATADGIM
jgi:glycosyltransferase involved in cell wall biosynthesis